MNILIKSSYWPYLTDVFLRSKKVLSEKWDKENIGKWLK